MIRGLAIVLIVLMEMRSDCCLAQRTGADKYQAICSKCGKPCKIWIGDKIRAHLAQAAPHQKERLTFVLLKEALETIGRLEGLID